MVKRPIRISFAQPSIMDSGQLQLLFQNMQKSYMQASLSSEAYSDNVICQAIYEVRLQLDKEYESVGERAQRRTA